MKRIVKATATQWDIDRVRKEREQAQINEVYEGIKRLVADIEDLPNSIYDKMYLSELYKELLNSIQDNYKYYQGNMP